MGEPAVSLFITDEIDALLRNQGFGDIVRFGVKEARDVYFTGRDDIEIAGAQRLAATTLSRRV